MLARLIELLFGGSGVAAGVTNAAKLGTAIVAAPLAYQWFQGHAHDELVRLDMSQGLAIAGVLFVVIQVAHIARGPGQ